MPSLSELQRDLAHALLSDGVMPAAIQGRLRSHEALAIHRNTVLGALVNALRLSHPTVDRLVGEAFFDQAACLYAKQQPPMAAWLAQYGAGFADFLAQWAPAASLSYLADVARLDFAIEQTLQGSLARRCIALDADVAITLPETLSILALRYPADAIRAAMGDDAALAAIDMAPADRFVLVWRNERMAVVRRTHAVAAHFLAALQAGSSIDVAFASAGPQAAAILQAEIFAAPFCTVISNRETFSP